MYVFSRQFCVLQLGERQTCTAGAQRLHPRLEVGLDGDAGVLAGTEAQDGGGAVVDVVAEQPLERRLAKLPVIARLDKAAASLRDGVLVKV